MKQLAFNGRFLTRPVTGVERYATGLLAELSNHLGQAMALLAPRSAPSTMPGIGLHVSRVGKLRGHAWEQLELPRLAGERAIVNLCNLGPLVSNHQLTVIHDAAVFAMPGTFTRAFSYTYRLVLPLLARRSTHVATVSEFSRQELARYLGLRRDRIVLAPPGVDHIQGVAPDARVLDELSLRHRPFALTVGSLNPRKNVRQLVRVMASMPEVTLVLVGVGNERVFSGEAFELPSNVVAVGYVDDARLLALYRAARLFVFPSLYEGFGLPPIEAMAAGCPTLVARTSALPETCGDAAAYFDPFDARSLSEQLRRLWHDTPHRLELSARGLEHSARYSWRRTADAILPTLQELLG